jgi:site-specific DNA-methyltransferase (adenine-specific)
VNERIRAAFEADRQNESVDRVIADPALNARFLEKCRELGITASPATINRGLLNLRKAGLLRGLKSRAAALGDDDGYRFAAEMAVRFIERRDGLTLDAVLCDPELAAEFDRLASSISPGFSPLEYRWAALNLRKAKSLKPEILARVAQPERLLTNAVKDWQLHAIPSAQGLYLFFTRSECLYVGEAENLRNRLGKHLDHSDNKGLARWMWDQGTDVLFLELQLLAADTTQRVRRALELELIRSRRPLFNVQR